VVLLLKVRNMVVVLHGRGKWGPALVAVLLSCLAPGLQAALQKVGFSGTVNAALSLHAMDVAEKKELIEKMSMTAGALDSMQAVTLLCKDAAGAADVKKAVEASLTSAKGKLDGLLKNLKPDNPDDLQMIKETRNLLDAVKVSTKDVEVNAEASIAAASAAKVMWAVLVGRPGGGLKTAPEVKKSTDSK
jgi:hypothetical protein